MVAVGVPSTVIFLWKGVKNMTIVRVVAGIVLAFGVDVFIMLLLFDKAIKREEKRHQAVMDEIKGIDNKGCV